MKALEYERRKAELCLRRQLVKTHDLLWERYLGNAVAVNRAKSEGMRLIMNAVNCGDISTHVADSLKTHVQEWDVFGHVADCSAQ